MIAFSRSNQRPWTGRSANRRAGIRITWFWRLIEECGGRHCGSYIVDYPVWFRGRWSFSWINSVLWLYRTGHSSVVNYDSPHLSVLPTVPLSWSETFPDFFKFPVIHYSNISSGPEVLCFVIRPFYRPLSSLLIINYWAMHVLSMSACNTH